MKENRLSGETVNCTLEDNGSWEESVLLLTAKRLREISTRKRSSDFNGKNILMCFFSRHFQWNKEKLQENRQEDTKRAVIHTCMFEHRKGT